MLALLTYFLALRPTWELYRTNRQLEGQVQAARYAPATLKQLRQEMKSYERVLQSVGKGESQREEEVLNVLTQLCRQHGVRLVSFPSLQTEEQAGYRIETRHVRLRGTFVRLLKVVNGLETAGAVGRLASVRFVLEEDRQRRSTHLSASIYLQTLSASEQ